MAIAKIIRTSHHRSIYLLYTHTNSKHATVSKHFMKINQLKCCEYQSKSRIHLLTKISQLRNEVMVSHKIEHLCNFLNIQK